jgi:hypothetical protein
MFANILGGIWILMGLWWMIRPASLKNRLKRKMTRRLKLVIYCFVFSFGILIMGSVVKASGLVAKIVGVVALYLAIKAIVLVTSKTSEKVFEWWGERPIIFFRLWALFFLGAGVYLIIG